MVRPRVTVCLRFHKTEQQRLASLYARRAALVMAIRSLEDYRRLRAKRLAAGLLKIA
ncbi:MAG: hypothetical protein ABSB23_11770 [Bryobacteraceae bacterium]|jgi:hypothetical protein